MVVFSFGLCYNLQGRKWEDDIQPYGRDTRDDEDDDFLPRKQSASKKKPHGKYNVNNKKSKRR